LIRELHKLIHMLPGCIRSTVLSAVAIIVVLAVLSGPSRADLKLCNTTSSRIGVSIGYQEAKELTTEGWWTLPAHTCETLFKGALPGRLWYVHAIDYDRGGEWAGKAFMCTKDKAFTIRGVQDCAGRGYKRTGFFEVDTQDASDWTIRLTDPGEGSGTQK
jgi:uncharacterized membrane protein